MNQHLLLSPVYHARLGNGYSLSTGFSTYLGNLIEFNDVFFAVEKDISEGVKIGCRVSSARWRITWDYHGQKIFIPVILGEQMNSDIAFYGIIIPALTFLGVELTYLQSRRERLKREKILNERKLWTEKLNEKREQALEIQSLLRAQTIRKQSREKDKGGLFIQSAEYGSAKEMIDVTLPIAAMVNESQLVLPANAPKV
ncbi:putative J domain-containing protein [Neolecta irregularis DAH-3]|uniref:Putative J domain-containing protein n=1 Tax=Neolecta irregularis (strain DAH-3) TaxID=1198029 RepID=A0A1U7LHG2_NEOID|nr:putative J domain-containing protein [Neolecta irregularis DAH-3]|eukprot:OLL22095.1 putative J domain-containing protein [Neolecta irregularis DAH-3]